MSAAVLTPLLEARNAGRRKPHYRDWLLRGIDVRIGRGSRLAVVGGTGSGKTLLLRSLARLDRLDEGALLFNGTTVAGNAVPEFRSKVIYLHQHPPLWEGTVEDNLRLPFQLGCHRQRSFSREAIVARFASVRRDPDFLDQSAQNLSGGEAQIVALIRAMQLDPHVLLLDEPTAALDRESTHLVEQLVDAWFDESESERAVVWVSHDPHQVARVSDQVFHLRDGRLAPGDDFSSEAMH